MLSRSVRLALVLPLFALPACGQDGDLDSSFGGDGIVAASLGTGFQAAFTLAALPDGSLLAGGVIVEAGDPNADLYVIRYNPNGSVDGGWGDFGGQRVAIDVVADGWDEALAIVPETGGGVTILGSAETSGLFLGGSSANLPALVRLTAAGEFDSGFGDGGIAVPDSHPWSGTIQILAASAHLGGYLFFGQCTACAPGDEAGRFLYRALAGGGGDPAFGAGGWLSLGDATIGQLSAFGVDPAGRIVLAGDYLPQFGDPELRVHRRLPSGLPDSSFDGDGTVAYAPEDTVQWAPRAIAFDPVDGAIVLSLQRNAGIEIAASSLLRFSAGGAFVASFGQPVLAYDQGVFVQELAIDGLRRIFAGGSIDGPGDQPGGFFFARLLPTGALDDGFDDNGVKRVEVDAVANGWDQGFALALSGGRPLAAGHSQTQSGGQRFALVRLTNALIFADGFEVGSTGSW